MENHLDETIVEYRRAQLASWKAGDKSLVPRFVES